MGQALVLSDRKSEDVEEFPGVYKFQEAALWVS